MAIPTIAGTPTSGGIAGAGNFTVSLPTGATGYLAVCAYYGDTLHITPPSGWTAVVGPALAQAGNFWTAHGIWKADTGTSPGTTWDHGNGDGSASVVIMGYDGVLTINASAGADVSDLTCPTTTTTEGALIARVLMINPYGGSAPTAMYPSGHTIGQAERAEYIGSGTDYLVAAISHISQPSAGATGTAAYGINGAPSWEMHRAQTLALTAPGGSPPANTSAFFQMLQ